MTAQATAGSKLSIGTTTLMTTAAAYAADTWTEVTQISDLGESGDTASEIKAPTIADSRVRKLAGTVDGGDQTIVVNFDPTDAGQVAMRAAIGVNVNHNFKVTLNDAPATGSSPTPTTFYFNGIVMEGPVKMGNGDTVVSQTFKIAINSVKIMVAATAGT